MSRPRQTLEELFLEIVEQARAERLETSGAQHGGQTAAFLRAEPEGEALIDRLVAPDEPAPAPRAATPEPAKAGPDASLIAALTSDRPATGQTTRPVAPPAKLDTSEVDLSVIDSLVDADAQRRPAPPERKD